MLRRILTALVLIPAVVALVWFAPPLVLAAVGAVVAILALHEFFDLGERQGAVGFKKWTIACSAALFYAQYTRGLVETRNLSGAILLLRGTEGRVLSLEAVLLIFVFGAISIGLFTRRSLVEVLPAVAVSGAGFLFVIFPFSYLLRLNETQTVGRQLVLFTLSMIWAGDMLAYFVGRSLGRVAMAPLVSPNKTWEGALGNLFGSLLVAVAFARWLQIDIVSLMMVAALGNIAGQMGDLIESAFKRGASVKDSGALLPGHGGIYDRIDSLILAAPVVWAACQFLLVSKQ
jgi:phosphatidate cytidylyltransferase